MRIAINARLFLRDKMEGIGRHGYELVTRLIALHPQHTFLLFYDRSQNIIVPPGTNTEVICLPPFTRHPLLLWYWTDIKLKHALKQYRADLFYSPEPILPARILIPSIITIHDISPLIIPHSISWDHRMYYQYILKRNSRNASGIITVSNFSKNEIINHFPETKDKITVLYNAASSSYQPAMNKASNQPPYFISVSSIHDRKNIDHIIKAFDIFKNNHHTDHRLILVGRRIGRHDRYLQALTQSPHKSDIIETGYLAEEKKIALLGSATALINLSEYEGFGMQLIEAFQSGVPVIAADKSCYVEITQGAAWLIDPEDREAVAELLARSRQDNKDMIQRGLIRARDFDWDISATKLSDLIHRLFG